MIAARAVETKSALPTPAAAEADHPGDAGEEAQASAKTTMSPRPSSSVVRRPMREDTQELRNITSAVTAR